eukprot:m.85385 g.85385  ORF g.85385 m.85385 type:complete len:481 (-) comp15052_c0_seq3:585-2027(-)
MADTDLPPLQLQPALRDHLLQVFARCMPPDSAEKLLTATCAKLGQPPACTTVRFDPGRETFAEAAQGLRDLMARRAHAVSADAATAATAATASATANTASDSDTAMTAAAHIPPIIEAVPGVPELLSLRCDRVSPVPQPASEEVLVDAACGMAVLRGADVYGPGVMGMTPGIAAPHTRVAVYADLEAKALRGLAKTYMGRKLFVGNGIAVRDRTEFFQQAQAPPGVQVFITEPLFRNPSLDLRGLEDRFFLQNLPSCVAVRVLAPAPGQAVLDMCAAPGGKTTHIAAMMRGSGRLVALERSPKRAEELKRFVQAAGLPWVEVHAADATKLVQPPGQAAKKPKIDFPCDEASFDRVLLDAPCTGLGQRPRNVCPTSAKDAMEAPQYQKKLFAVAVRMVKPGGTLVYSTCSFNPEENEEIVAWALATFPHLQLAPQSPYLGEPGLQCPGLTAEQCALLQRYCPTGRADTIGFFIAKFLVPEA